MYQAFYANYWPVTSKIIHLYGYGSMYAAILGHVLTQTCTGLETRQVCIMIIRYEYCIEKNTLQKSMKVQSPLKLKYSRHIPISYKFWTKIVRSSLATKN